MGKRYADRPGYSACFAPWVKLSYAVVGFDGLKDRWGNGGAAAVSDGDLAAVKARILQAALRPSDADCPALTAKSAATSA